MPPIKLIALDLDGTLLNSEKILSERNLQALTDADKAGITIVPATGRFFNAMPEAIRTLPFVRYAITINGACVLDIPENKTIYNAEISLPQALEIMSALESLPVLFECYQDNWGWISEAMQRNAEQFAPNAYYLNMIRSLRTPVPDLRKFLIDKGKGVQKIQMFFKDPVMRLDTLRTFPERFPEIAVSSSVPNNIELNAADANKGAALESLADYLNIPLAETMAFGDGLNDISMLRRSGLGVAMGNACAEAKEAAAVTTGSCDESGVAQVIEQILRQS